MPPNAPAEPAVELEYPPLVLTRVPLQLPYPQSQPLQQASQHPSLHASQQQPFQEQPPPPPELTLGGTAW